MARSGHGPRPSRRLAASVRCKIMDTINQEEFISVNKTKRVAWHKRLKKIRKREEKARAARGAPAATARPGATRR